MTTTNTSLTSRLQTIAAEGNNTIRQYIASYVLESYESNTDIIGFFQDLAQYGCVSGIVSNMIYYADTCAFFDTYYHEIEELRMDHEENFGQPLTADGDLKNFYAWFAFEEVARSLALELGIDL